MSEPSHSERTPKSRKKRQYSPELIEKIAEYRSIGLSRDRIANTLQIPKTTIQEWETKKKYRSIFADKALSVVSSQIQKVLSDTSVGAQSARWWLERQVREEFAPPTQKTELQTKSEVLVALEFTGIGGQITGKQPLQVDCKIEDAEE